MLGNGQELSICESSFKTSRNFVALYFIPGGLQVASLVGKEGGTFFQHKSFL